MKPITVIVIGAGSRGFGYAQYAREHPAEARVVGVAEPRAEYRRRFLAEHDIPAAAVATDWRVLADRPRFADAVLVTTQDALHTEPAVAFAARGYHLLLEKPMATTPADCARIVAAVRASGVMLAVCHVLRYTPFTRRLKGLLDEGTLGEIVNIQHLEPVGFWHQAHSFVRGNWRREDESTFMLMAKCCHNIDWLRYLMGAPCLAVSSFGSLKHFRRSEKPVGAGERCLDCAIEPTCPYSAKRIYLTRAATGATDWPLNVLSATPTLDTITAALREGPYGRCVYACDNDVVDNQVVNLLYAGNRTATLTMVAFAQTSARRTRIFGTRGELSTDGNQIRHYDFLADAWREVDLGPLDPTAAGGHGGGDEGLMQAFCAAVAHNDPRLILSGPDETLESHLTVFAAEQARREQRVIDVPTFAAQQVSA